MYYTCVFEWFITDLYVGLCVNVSQMCHLSDVVAVAVVMDVIGKKCVFCLVYAMSDLWVLLDQNHVRRRHSFKSGSIP